MKNKKKLILLTVIAIAIAGGLIYSKQLKTDTDDTPPQLTFGGDLYKGMITDPGGYWQYETGDTCTHDAGLESKDIKKGTHIYHVAEDGLTMKDLVNRINCVAQNRIRIHYWDPFEEIMYSFPKAVYTDTTAVADLNAAENIPIHANTGIIIESSKDTKIGGVLGEAEYANATAGMFSTGGGYDFLNNIVSGWVLIPGVEGTEFSSELNSSGLKDRVLEVFTQTAGEAAFNKEIIADNGSYNVAFDDDGYYMIWMKLSEEVEPEVIEMDEVDQAENVANETLNLGANEVTNETYETYEISSLLVGVETTNTTLIPDCEGAETVAGYDIEYICTTDGANPSNFLTSGAEACEAVDKMCVTVEWSRHNTDGGYVNFESEINIVNPQDCFLPKYRITEGDGSNPYVDECPDCARRAACVTSCGEEGLIQIEDQPYVAVCMTDGGELWNLGGGSEDPRPQGKILYKTGHDACEAANTTCVTTQIMFPLTDADWVFSLLPEYSTCDNEIGFVNHYINGFKRAICNP